MSSLTRKYLKRGAKRLAHRVGIGGNDNYRRRSSRTAQNLPKNPSDRAMLEQLDETIETLRDERDELQQTLNDMALLKKRGVDRTTIQAQLFEIDDKLTTLNKIRTQYESLIKTRDLAADYSYNLLVKQNVELMLTFFKLALADSRRLNDTVARVANAMLGLTPYLRSIGGAESITPQQILAHKITFRNAMTPRTGEVQHTYDAISISTANMSYLLTNKMIHEYAHLLQTKQLRNDRTRAFYDRILAWMGLTFDSNDIVEALYSVQNKAIEIKARLNAGAGSLATVAGVVDSLVGGPNAARKQLFVAAGLHALIRTVVPFALRPTDVYTVGKAFTILPIRPVEAVGNVLNIYTSDTVGVNNLIITTFLAVPAVTSLTSWLYSSGKAIQHYLNIITVSDVMKKQAQVLKETTQHQLPSLDTPENVLPQFATAVPLIPTIKGNERIPGQRTLIDNILTFYSYARYTQELATFLQAVQSLAYEELKMVGSAIELVSGVRNSGADRLAIGDAFVKQEYGGTIAELEDLYDHERDFLRRSNIKTQLDNATKKRSEVIAKLTTNDLIQYAYRALKISTYAIRNDQLYRYFQAIARASIVLEKMTYITGGIYLPNTAYAVTYTRTTWKEDINDIGNNIDKIVESIGYLTDIVKQLSPVLQLDSNTVGKLEFDTRWQYVRLLEFYRCTHRLANYLYSFISIMRSNVSELEISFSTAYMGVTNLTNVQEGGVNLTPDDLEKYDKGLIQQAPLQVLPFAPRDQRVQLISPAKVVASPAKLQAGDKLVEPANTLVETPTTYIDEARPRLKRHHGGSPYYDRQTQSASAPPPTTHFGSPTPGKKSPAPRSLGSAFESASTSSSSSPEPASSSIVAPKAQHPPKAQNPDYLRVLATLPKQQPETYSKK